MQCSFSSTAAPCAAHCPRPVPVVPAHQSHQSPAKQTARAFRCSVPEVPVPLSTGSFTDRIVCAASVASPAVLPPPAATSKKPLHVVVAGAGIGGLVLAVALLKKGIKVTVLERDLTAIRGEGKYRGPIQVQSNALAALEAIDPAVAEQVLQTGCITGDRINGLCDGVTGDWYVKFDTFHPAASRGLPITRVISRVSLQNILAKAVLKYGGQDAILGSSHVTHFSEVTDEATGRTHVKVDLEDGRTFTGDLLIGADGIWSKIRKQLIGETKANYSGYTCYTGISDFTPADIDVVGYRVFLGNGLYFVSSDVGGGKVQWYAFHKEPAGGSDAEGQRKQRLLSIFGHWNDNVVDLIKATPEEDVLRRDIYDRPPIFSWAKGRIALLGDSAHAMQPNLGQGGCMAIEDAYELAHDLATAAESVQDVSQLNVEKVLHHYQNQRMMRVSAIHGMAGMAAYAASTYKAYLGEGVPGIGPWLEQFKIPHPGRVAGQFILKLTMPLVLEWVLGGNCQNLTNRAPHCRVGDKPRAFPESKIHHFLNDDSEIIRSTTEHADWLLVSERSPANAEDALSSAEAKGIYIRESPASVGRSTLQGCSLIVDDVRVVDQHAKVWRQGHEFFIQDNGSTSGTWVNGKKLQPNQPRQLHPADLVEFGRHPAPEVFKVKLQHVSLRNASLQGHSYNTLLVGKKGGEAAVPSAQPSPKPVEHSMSDRAQPELAVA